MRSTSSLNPRLSILSASSSTSVEIEESRTAFFSTSSSSRPGVATTMFALPTASICGLIETPPDTARQVKRSVRAGRNVWKTCCT